MFTKRILLGVASALVGITLVSASSVRSQTTQPSGPTADQQSQMDAWTAAAAAGPEHDWIKQQFVGDWDADVSIVAPVASKSKGVMHCKMILGGRFLQLDYDGEMIGPDGKSTAFHGHGIGGYDNGKKKFTDFWIDELSTGMMMTEGTRDGKVMTLDGNTTEPMSGQPIKVREVITVLDNDHHKYELFMGEPDGTMGKSLEIMYTRKG